MRTVLLGKNRRQHGFLLSQKDHLYQTPFQRNQKSTNWDTLLRSGLGSEFEILVWSHCGGTRSFWSPGAWWWCPRSRGSTPCRRLWLYRWILGRVRRPLGLSWWFHKTASRSRDLGIWKKLKSFLRMSESWIKWPLEESWEFLIIMEYFRIFLINYKRVAEATLGVQL